MNKRYLFPLFRLRKKVIRKRTGAHIKHYLLHKESARVLVHARLEHFNRMYRYNYNKVFIKNTRSRWGSCSSKHNLNFNYKIVLLPPDLADYIIVHELCHLGEFNHSAAFWALIEKTIPDYRERVVALKNIRISIS